VPEEEEAASPATDLAPEPGDTVTDAPRVAPRPSERPAPEAEVAPVPEDAAEPVPAPEATETPERVEQAAPEEATTRIVTEATEEGGAEQIALAPAVAPRPRARPARPPAPVPDPVAQPDPAPPEDPLSSAIDGALGAAGGGARTGDPGPPLTVGERDALRVAVQECWVVDVGSEAASVVVTVAMSMSPDGTVIGNEVRLVSAEGGSETSRSAAFQSARRAVLRCQGDGYDLPPEKYDQWREIEIVFNPAEMRLR
jgi:hypothetical protein